MLSGSGAVLNDENRPPSEWTIRHWTQYIASEAAKSNREHLLHIYETAVNTIRVDDANKNDTQLRDIYTSYAGMQEELKVDPLKVTATRKLLNRYWPPSSSLDNDAVRPRDTRMHSPQPTSKIGHLATPMMKTPSPDQQQIGLSTHRVSRRRFHIGGGGGAQRVRLGPPVRVSDANTDGEGDVDPDLKDENDDSFEQPPTIRARPSKSALSSSLPSLSSMNTISRNASSTNVGAHSKDDENLPLDEVSILRDLTLPESSLPSNQPVADARIGCPAQMQDVSRMSQSVSVPEIESEDDDMIVDSTMMPTIRYAEYSTQQNSLIHPYMNPTEMTTPKRVQLFIPTPPKEADLSLQPSLRSHSRTSSCPGLPSFGNDASMHRALEEMNIQPWSKPIKLYNPVGAMTPKAGIEVNQSGYRKIGLIGRGGSSKVYKIMNSDGELFALKKVNLRGLESDAIEDYKNEIALLQKLKNNSRIIRLYDAEVNLERGVILMVLEYGEIDLAHLLNRDQGKLSENFIRLYWEEMLEAVNSLHAENVIHSDLKPANFLMVQGALKLIDFGIAKHIPNDTTNIHRDHQTGTLNYMSPEAITYDTGPGVKKPLLKLGRSSDVWSLGCILYQFVYALLDAMKGCLKRNPKDRMTIPELLHHPFLHPRSLPMELTPRVIQDILEAVHQARSLQPLSLERGAQILCRQIKAGSRLDLTKPL
ncbi:hypothetical protein SeLEV6574_g03781 [Synchytrium endobioticum]|uniref:Protein kinase domain-containing protein n=1 Tax=Synchytrium endobioticum TaxID=286115 RepID=A0A507D282_9FUNG|nr:hypothetical protein SeLEV6574_g03781 [Synchytrium endobioticum]